MSFRPDPEFDAGLRRQPEFKKAMAATAVELAVCIRIAAEPSRNTGYFIRRIVPQGDRVKLLDPFWHLVEFGSVNNPPYAPARRGVRLAGLRYEDARGGTV